MKNKLITERELQVGDFVLASPYESKEEFLKMQRSESIMRGAREWSPVIVWGIEVEPAYESGLYVKCVFLKGSKSSYRFKRYAGINLDIGGIELADGVMLAHLPPALMWHFEFVHRLQHVFNEIGSPLSVELKQVFDKAGYNFNPEEIALKHVEA